MLCDNQVTVQAMNSGTSRNSVIQACLHEMHKVTGWHSIQVKLEYLESSQNRILDALSRFHLNERFRTVFKQEVSSVSLEEYIVHNELWAFCL